MAAIILPHRWNQQPQQAIEVDYGNPLTAQLTIAINGATTPANSNIITTNECSGFRSIRAISGTSGGLSAQNTSQISNTGGAICLIANHLTSSNTKYFFDVANPRTYLVKEFSSSNFSLVINTTSIISAGLANLITSVPSIIIVNWTQTSQNIYKNGQLWGQASATINGTPGAYTFYLASQTTLSSGLVDGGIALFQHWNRTLSSSEIRTLSENPWQIYKPLRRRIWSLPSGPITPNHAIELTATGTYTFSGHTFNNYAATDGATGNEAVFVNVSSGSVTINITNGGSTPSIRTAGATVTVNNSKSKTFTNLPSGTEVRIRQGSYTLAHDQDVTSGSYAYSYTPNDKPALAQFTLPGYIFEDIAITLNSTDQSLPVVYSPDPSYI